MELNFNMPISFSSSSSNLLLETSKVEEDINLSVSTLSASENESSMVMDTFPEEVVMVMPEEIEPEVMLAQPEPAVIEVKPVPEFEIMAPEPLFEKEMVMLEEDFLPIRPSEEPDVNLANPRKRRISNLPTMNVRRQSVSAPSDMDKSSKVKPTLEVAGVHKEGSSIPLRRSSRLSLSASIASATPASLIATAMSRMDKISTPIVETEPAVASSSTKKQKIETFEFYPKTAASPKVPTPSALNDSADIDPTIIKLEDFENIDWLGEKETTTTTSKVNAARRASVGGNPNTRRKSLARITSMLDNLTQEINSMPAAKKPFGFSVAAANVKPTTNALNVSTTSFSIHEDKDRRVTRSMAVDEPVTKQPLAARRKSIQPMAKDNKIMKASIKTMENNENARNEVRSEHRWIDI